MSEIIAAEKILGEKANIREILFEPNRKQYMFLKAKARYVAFGGARGGGKAGQLIQRQCCWRTGGRESRS